MNNLETNIDNKNKDIINISIITFFVLGLIGFLYFSFNNVNIKNEERHIKNLAFSFVSEFDSVFHLYLINELPKNNKTFPLTLTPLIEKDYLLFNLNNNRFSSGFTDTSISYYDNKYMVHFYNTDKLKEHLCNDIVDYNHTYTDYVKGKLISCSKNEIVYEFSNINIKKRSLENMRY